MEQILFTTREQESLKAWMDDHGEVGQLILREQPVAPPLSEPGHAVMYWDDATDTMLCSVDGAPFVTCVSAAAGPGAPVGSTQFNDNGVFGGDTPMHVAAFGTDRQAIQDAIDATPVGGMVQLACIAYTLDATPISITKALTLQGCHQGESYPPDAAPSVTTLNAPSGSTVLALNTNEAVTLRDFSSVLGVGTGSTGTHITLEGPAANAGSRFERLALYFGQHGIVGTEGRVFQFTARDNLIWQPTTTGIHLGGYLNGVANCDGGLYRLDNNLIYGLATGDGLLFDNSAAVMLSNNNVQTWQNSLHIRVGLSTPCAGPGPTQWSVIGNQMDVGGASGGHSIFMEIDYGTGYYAISNNLLGTTGGNDDVVFANILSNGIFGMAMSSNTFANVGKRAVRIQGSALGIIASSFNDNILAFAGTSPAISITNAGYGVSIADNTLTNPVDDQILYEGDNLVIQSFFNGGHQQTLATLPPNAGEGSMMWCTDCRTTNPCTAGGNGTFARREGLFWLCGAPGFSVDVDEIAYGTGSGITGNADLTFKQPRSELQMFSSGVSINTPSHVRALLTVSSGGTLDGSGGEILGTVLMSALGSTSITSTSGDTNRLLVGLGDATINSSSGLVVLGNDGAEITHTADSMVVGNFHAVMVDGLRSAAIGSIAPTMAQTDMVTIIASNNGSATTTGGGSLVGASMIAGTRDAVIDGAGIGVENIVIIGGTGGSVTGVGNAVSINGGVVVNDGWTVVGGTRMQVGSLPNGTLATGPFIVGVNAPNGTGAQAGLFQTTSEPPAGEGLVTLGQDNVAVSGWAFRGSTSTNPLYGGNFGVHFLGTGQTRGVEIDVQNEFADAGEGAFGEHVGLWLNRSGTYNASSAIEISSQDNRGWWHGIHFDPGGAGTGSDTLIKGWGIRWFRASSAQFISMVPADDFLPSANAVVLYAFDGTTEKAKLNKRGQWFSRGDDTGLTEPAFTFIDEPTTGLYMPAAGQLGMAVTGTEVFKAVTAPVTGTLTHGYMASVGTIFGSLGAVINGALIYCSDCTQTNPCGSGGAGAFALGINAAWDCSAAGGGGGGGTLTGSGATTRIAVWDAATDLTGFSNFTWDEANLNLDIGGNNVTGAFLASLIGGGNDASGGLSNNVFAHGLSNVLTIATNSGAWGVLNSLSNTTTCFAVGYGNTITASDSQAFGESNSVVSCNDCVAVGQFNTLTGGGDGYIFGELNAVANGVGNNVVVGASNTLSGTTGNAYIVGQTNVVSGNAATRSMVLGHNNTASHATAYLFGSNLVSVADGSVSLGVSATPEFTITASTVRVLSGGVTMAGTVFASTAIGSGGTLDGTANPVVAATLINSLSGTLIEDNSAAVLVGVGSGEVTRSARVFMLASDGGAVVDAGFSGTLASFVPSITTSSLRSMILGSQGGTISGGTNALILGGTDGAITNSSDAVAINGGVVTHSHSTVVGGTSFSTPGMIDIKQFGAVGDGSNDDTAEIQDAIDAAEASGAEVFCSPGTYKVSAALTVTQPLVFRGTRGLAPSTLTGCIIVAANATQDIFNVSLPNTTSNPPYDFDGGAFVLEDVTLGASVVKTAGAGIFITNAGASCSGAILDKVAILDQWDGVDSDKACGVTIVNSRIAKWRNRGIHLENQSAIDGGSYRISGNYIFSVLGGAAIEWHSGGDMQITGNAIGTLGPYGIDITATNSGGGPSVATTMISVTGNEIESPSSAALNISAAAGQALARVTATGNMMTCSASGCSGIRTSEVTLGSVNSITMTGNVVSADNCFDVAGGDAVMIAGNTCSTSWNGISVSAAALNVSIGENYIVAGSKDFNISNTTTSILTARPVTLAALPTAANGTRIWCSDCTPTATLLACSGAGAGAMAVRTGGAWKCIG